MLKFIKFKKIHSKFFLGKNFSTLVGNKKKLTNINSLNKFVMNNYQMFTKEDFIDIFNKFQEFEGKDPNAKLKMYDLLDYVMSDEKIISDNVLLKTVMRVLLSVQLNDKLYWDYFKKLIIKNNFLFSSKYNYLDYLKIYSIVNYEDSEIWKIFEEYFLEAHGSFDIEEVQSIALCFGNNKKGSKQFWVKMLDTFDLKNENYSDFILNFSVCLCGFLQSKIIDKIDRVLIAYFCKYLNFSTQFLQKLILQGISLEKIDMVYSLFHNFHKTYYIDKIHVKFPNYLEKTSLKNLIETLESFVKNYLDKNINKLEDEDFEQISKILKYSKESKILFAKLKPSVFVKIFIDDVANIKNYSDLYNFLNYFHSVGVKEEKLKKTFSEETVWEKFIESMHLMSFEELINLSAIMKDYNVKHFRVWIFIQNFFRKHVRNILEASKTESYEKVKGSYEQIERILKIFNDPKFKFEEFVMLPFIVLLQTSLEQLDILNSHKIVKH